MGLYPSSDVALRNPTTGIVTARHSITSSARASKVGGISRPSSFAVLRLMISSNLVWGLHRQRGRLGPAQNTVGIVRRLSIDVGEIKSVRNQSAIHGEPPERIHRRQPELFGEADDQGAMHHGQAVRDPRKAGIELPEQLEPFTADREFEISEAGGVSAGMRQVVDEALPDRIGHHRKDDWQSTRILLDGLEAGSSHRDNDVGALYNQHTRVGNKSVVVSGCDANVDDDVAAFTPAELSQCGRHRTYFRLGEPAHKPNPGHAFRLLRSRRERPRRRSAAEGGQQFPPSDGD
jgi:hypothetical protein